MWLLGLLYLSHALAISKHTAAKSCGAGRNKNLGEFLAAVESSFFVYALVLREVQARRDFDTGRERIVADALTLPGP